MAPILILLLLALILLLRWFVVIVVLVVCLRVETWLRVVVLVIVVTWAQIVIIVFVPCFLGHWVVALAEIVALPDSLLLATIVIFYSSLIAIVVIVVLSVAFVAGPLIWINTISSRVTPIWATARAFAGVVIGRFMMVVTLIYSLLIHYRECLYFM